MNEFEAHESSYDHQHKKVGLTLSKAFSLISVRLGAAVASSFRPDLPIPQRLKEMKQMQRDPNASDKARRAERKADEKSGLITIKPLKLGDSSSASGAGGFKKGGFKDAFAPTNDDSEEESKPAAGFRKAFADEPEPVSDKNEDYESDSDDFGYEYYDPRRPTGCDEHCLAR